MALAKDLVPAFPAGQAAANGGQCNGALVATGSTLANSTPVVVSNSIVTGADGAKGVTLPAMAPGELVLIFNNSASTLLVWPPSATVALSTPGSGMGTAGNSASLTTFRLALIVAITATQYIFVLA